jgi:hypothetical protein
MAGKTEVVAGQILARMLVQKSPVISDSFLYQCTYLEQVRSVGSRD